MDDIESTLLDLHEAVDELDESKHDTLASQLLLIIALMALVNYLSTFLVQFKGKRPSISMIQPHTIALLLGLAVGLLI